MLQLSFHRIFCQMAITAQNLKNHYFLKIKKKIKNSLIPLQNIKLPDISFESGLSSKIALLTTLFRKTKILVYIWILPTVLSTTVENKIKSHNANSNANANTVFFTRRFCDVYFGSLLSLTNASFILYRQLSNGRIKDPIQQDRISGCIIFHLIRTCKNLYEKRSLVNTGSSIQTS